MSELTHATAVELAARIRERDVSVREVVQAHLDRIDEVNPMVNAIVAMFDRDQVVAEADRLDREPVAGPLYGLPVAVKDLDDVAGLPTRRGSTVTSARPARDDGATAARLRAAGALIIGKTNTPELGTGSHTFNEVYGVTRNPWDTTRSAGGSSGGSAAALAARMLPIADGSDLGGSLRNPAGFCNVVGLRPSIGRVPEPADRSTHLLRLGVHGPMGRTVADAALVLTALAGPDPRDPLSLAAAGSTFAPPIHPPTGVRLAWGGDLGLFGCEADVLSVCRRAAERVRVIGGEVVEARPDLTDAMRVFRVLRGVGYLDKAAQIPTELQGRLKATIRENIEFARGLSVDDVLEAERARAGLHIEMERFFRDFDVLALPSAQVVPFPVEVEYPTEIEGVATADYLEWMSACCVITPTGCPAISIPAGFTDAGLPVGLQLVARVGAERALLEIAAAIEAVEPFHQRVPVVSPAPGRPRPA